MKRFEPPKTSIPQHDYGVALKSAVTWLGNRYLLADPMPRRRDERKEYFIETRRWHDARNAKGPTANMAR
jgi:hypothetical protein